MDFISENVLQDCSTLDKFQFFICCAECKEIWKSRPVRFSKVGQSAKTEGKKVIFQALYNREKIVARKQAVREAEQIFSLCPICQRLVCDYCFLVCDDLDLCTSCAKKLKEKGEPVREREKMKSCIG